MAIMIGTAAEARAYGKAGARAADQAGQTALVTACSKFLTKDRKSGDYLMGSAKRHRLGLLK